MNTRSVKWLLAPIIALGVAAVSSAAVTPGAWSDSFAEAKAYADANRVPMVLVWGNIQNGKHCEYCDALWDALDNAQVKGWMAERGYVFCHVWGKNKKDDPAQPQNAGATEFARTANGTKAALTSFPHVCVYWPKSADNVVVDNFVGRMTAAEFMAKVDGYLGDYGAYNGGKFTVGNTVGDRLEAEQSTAWVDVLVERDSSKKLDAAEEKLTLTYPSGAAGRATVARAIAWVEGECEKRVRVAFADLAGFSFSVGEEVKLALSDAEGAALDESLIALVRRGNSPKNPLWIGKKTADQLAWGEWTMDLDVAAAKVAAAKAGGGTAHLLVSFGGSIWCPDCAKTERYLVDTAEFKAWTLANNVACVAIDIPNLSAANPLTGPCLLTRDKRNVSAAYSAADPDHGTVQSGAGYLSRWMVSDDDAEATLARNKRLVGMNTKNGGWNRPERANQYRTGVPVFALVDASSLKVTSRIELFSASSPTDSNALAGHIRRFNELLAVENAVDAAFEEDNRDVSTTTAKIAVGGEAKSGEVSGGDLVDMFEVTGAGFDARTVLTATPGVESDVAWRLSLVQVGDAGAKTVAASEGTGELSVFGDLDEADGGKVYAKVEVTGLGSTAESFGADVDATIPYALAATSVETPGVVGFDAAAAEAFIPSGRDFSVSVSRVGGRSGAVKARVYLKDAGSAAEYSFEETVLAWGAGENGAKEVPFEAWRPAGSLASGSFALGLEIVEGGDSVGTGACTVTLTDTAAPGFASSEIEVSAHLTFKTAETIPLMNVSAGVAAKLKKTSGSLPKGISLSYDRKTGTATLKGTPKEAGVFTATYTVTQDKATGLPATITITVDDPKAVNPFVGVKRDSQTMPLLREAAGGTNVVAGALTVSATAAGKITAKLQSLDGSTVSCTESWTAFDAETGDVSTVLSGKNGLTIALRMNAAGTIYADVNGGEFAGQIDAPDGDFGDWEGSYTVTFPENPSEDGDASMAFATMTITTDGVVKWSATLSNSQAASGSSQLFGRDGDVAYVALFKATKKYAFSSLLKVRRGGGATWADQSRNQIIHNAHGTATFEGTGGDETLRAAFGGWWTPNAAPADLLAAFGYSDELTFESEAFDARGVLATQRGFTLEVVVRGDKLAYTKKTGVFSGSVSIPGVDGKTVKATIKGVLLPGWYSCGCEEPGEGEDELVTRPFGAGIAYCKVRNRSVSTTVSVPVYLKTVDLAE